MFNLRDQQGRLAGLLLLLLLCVLAGTVHATSTVSATAWLSAPAAVWSSVTGGSNTGAVAVQLMNAIQSDFTTAITALDSGAGVTVNTLVPNTAPASGPAYGTQTTYSVTTTTLTSTQIDDCVRGATMTHLNTLLSSAASALSLTITVLNANEPSDMTAIISSGYLPVTGASYMWQVVLDTLSTAGTIALAGFVIPIEEDLQSTIDSTDKLYLAVVSTDVSDSVVNASSLYVGYSVWSYPTNTNPSTTAALEATAMTTPLTKFNTFVSGLESTYSALADYSDLLPSSVSTWTPLVLDPSASSSASAVVVEGNITGNYLLTFSGTASTWGRVWASQQSAVAATIVAAAEAELARRAFSTVVEVLSASTVPNEKKYVGGLQVVCYVSHGYSVNSSHVWGPEDITSMLLQGDYTATQAFYTVAAATPSVKAALKPAVVALATTTKTAGALATTGIQYDYTAKLLPYEIGMIAMAAVIGFLALVAFFVALGCCCCCRHCISTNNGRHDKADWEADLDRYQQEMRTQDAAFAEAERPRAHAKKSRGVPTGEREGGTVTPNPLQSPDTQNIYSPREGDAEGLQRLQRSSPSPVNVGPAQGSLAGSDFDKKTPPPMETAQGVPLVALQTPPYSPAEGYGRYYDTAASPPPPPPPQAAVTAPPQEEDERSGSHDARPYQRTTVADDAKRGSPRTAASTDGLATPPPRSPRGNPATGTGYAPQYMANMTPTTFFALPSAEANGSAAAEVDAMNQTRLSQGSETRSHGATPTTAPPLPPPAYPQFKSPRTHQAATPPAYPMQEQTSPAYTPLQPTAYPTADLYTGAPAPAVTNSLGSFSPMPVVKKEN